MQIHLKLFLYILQWQKFTYWLHIVIILIVKKFNFPSLQRIHYPRNYVNLHVTHPPTSTHGLYMLFSWKTLLTWFTVYAADAVSMVHAVFMEMLVNTEPWKLFGFSNSFHFWYVWGIISISLEQVAFWGQSLRLQGDTFRWLHCRLKRHRTLLQVMYRQISPLITDYHA